jgi:hypothetical protein
VQPDLFGQWCFMREWGRIGRGGQMRETPYPTPADAEAALETQRRAKEGLFLLSRRLPFGGKALSRRFGLAVPLAVR